MEEKKTVEIISEEMVEKVINTLNEAEKKAPVAEDSNLDMNKVKEVIKSLAGCTPHTIVGIITTSLLLLPAGAIMAVLDMGKQALKAKAMAAIMDMIGKECPDCKAPEAPAE